MPLCLKRRNRVLSKKQKGSTVNTKRQKIIFPEEQVENADFYKTALNKVMTTHR